MYVIDHLASWDPGRSIHHTGHKDNLRLRAVRPEVQVRYELYNVDISMRIDDLRNSRPRRQGGRVICRERSWSGVLERGRGKEED